MYTITIDVGNGAVVHGEVPRMRRLDAKALFFAPAVLGFLAATWFPLALAVVAVVFASDMAQARGFLPPHQWLALRIERLVGGEN
jgi:hypothetical protein